MREAVCSVSPPNLALHDFVGVRTSQEKIGLNGLVLRHTFT